MIKSPIFSYVIAIVFSFATLPAFGQVIDDQVEFETACPDLTTEDFESIDLEPFPGLPSVLVADFPDGFSTPIGDYSTAVTAGPLELFVVNVDAVDTGIGFELLVGTNFVAFEADTELELTLAEPATHFGFSYIADDNATIEFCDADGNTIAIEALPVTDDLPSGNQNDIYSDEPLSFFGYAAPDGVEIASVKLSGGDVAFDNVAVGNCAPVDESCFGQIEGIKDSVTALIDASTGCQRHRLEAAFDCLCIMQDPLFWETENRLSCYGASFFVGGAYSIAYLEYSGHSDVEPIIASVLDLLECIVENEIDYAIANDGNDCHIYFAEAFADVAETFEEELDLPVVSALAYRLAWLHAYYATY